QPISPPPQMGVTIANQTFPLIDRPDLADLASGSGRFSCLSQVGARVVAVAVDSGALDETVTAVRKLWMTGHAANTAALILEGPRYNPVQLSSADASVAARSLTRTTLD